MGNNHDMNSYWQQKDQYFSMGIKKLRKKNKTKSAMELLSKSKQILLKTIYD